MRKQWLVGGSVAIIVVALAAGLVVSRAKSGEGPDGKGKKPDFVCPGDDSPLALFEAEYHRISSSAKWPRY